ncbi:MAG: bifunctional ADP-heptose synthase [Bacteroidales bacterium]|jgi:rfaE bifunctional protein kinase chain/domain|nr:bifunctional ADP-heptose synthase [Bacteroidales bacterium]MDD3702164.1 bifunctional ADP-heptose synthase [Bacteroidales bacterium]MDY0370415.1 bifunctional ADP-heptose synthase [Bacteroidales bacterium]
MILKTQTTEELFKAFGRMKVIVVGDVMVDAYLFGKVDRISPEAPVPVVSVTKRVNRMGGAANVALNLHSLGATPLLVSVLGSDPKSEIFIRLMQQQQLDTSAIIRDADRMTTTKFRIIGNNIQMLRVDEEVTHSINQDIEDLLFDQILHHINSGQIDLIIIQDYDKGVLTPGLIKRIIGLAHQQQIAVAVDPKKRNFLLYEGVNLFKPNLKELTEGLNVSVDHSSEADIKEAVRQLFEKLSPEKVLLTLSEKGVLIAYSNSDGVLIFTHRPAHVRKIADVSGAGDTVISVAGLCLAAGCDASVIAAVSNLAGGLVCEEVGVVPIDKAKLFKEIDKLTG